MECLGVTSGYSYPRISRTRIPIRFPKIIVMPATKRGDPISKSGRLSDFRSAKLLLFELFRLDMTGIKKDNNLSNPLLIKKIRNSHLLSSKIFTILAAMRATPN